MVFLSVILITSWSEEIIERRKCLKMWSSLPVSWTDIAMLLSWIWYELNTRAFNSVFRMGWGRLVPTIYWDIGMGTRILWCIWLQTPSARLTLVFLMIFDIFCIWEGYKIKGNLGFWLNLHWPPHPNLGEPSKKKTIKFWTLSKHGGGGSAVQPNFFSKKGIDMF